MDVEIEFRMKREGFLIKDIILAATRDKICYLITPGYNCYPTKSVHGAWLKQHLRKAQRNLHLDAHLDLDLPPVILDAIPMLPTPKDLQEF